MPSDSGTFEHVAVVVPAGVVMVVVGWAGAVETGTDVGAFPLFVAGGAAFGLLCGVAGFVEPLERAFDRARSVIAGLAVLAVFVVAGNESYAPQFVAAGLGIGGGAICGCLLGAGTTALRRGAPVSSTRPD